MPKKTLTDAFLRTVKAPLGKQVRYFETLERGLQLCITVSYGGTRTFSAIRYVNAKPKAVTLGRWPEPSLKDARAKARQYFEHPEKFAAETAVTTFKETAEQFIKRHVEEKRLRTQDEIERCFNKYIYPEWQDRAFVSIRRGDVNELLDKVVDEHGGRQADYCLAIISKLFRWYQVAMNTIYRQWCQA